jgi:hypothetical protein
MDTNGLPTTGIPIDHFSREISWRMKEERARSYQKVRDIVYLIAKHFRVGLW